MHALLDGCASVEEGPKRGDKGSRELIRWVHRDLVVLGVHVQEAKGSTPCRRVNHLINAR